MDRRLVTSVLAAVGALASGVGSLVLDAPALGLLAGGLGLVAGIAAAALAGRLRDREGRVDDLAADAARLRAEMEALATLLQSAAGSGASAGDAAARDLTPRSSEYAAARSRHPASTPARRDDGAPPGLVDEAQFTTLLHQRVASARRHLNPLSVVILAVAGGPGLDQRLDALARVLLRTLRECDSVARVNDLMLAIVLDGASEHGAVWAVERVRAALSEHPDDTPVQLSAGVACYPTHALEPRGLIGAAGRALEIARSDGSSCVQVAERDR